VLVTVLPEAAVLPGGVLREAASGEKEEKTQVIVISGQDQ